MTYGNFCFLFAFLCTLYLNVAYCEECGTGSIPNENGECEECPAGTYQDSNNGTECIKCRAGRFTPFTGVKHSSLCLACSSGEFSDSGATECKKCALGERAFCNECVKCAPGERFSFFNCKCEQCRVNEVSWKQNPVFCRSCRFGHMPSRRQHKCVLHNCPDGYWGITRYQDGKVKCSKCKWGTYRRGNMLNCEECPLGKYGNNANKGPNSRCVRSPRNTYIVNGGEQTKSSSKKWYLPCPEGSGTTKRGVVFCRKPSMPCPPNSFEDNDGDCMRCAANYYLDEEKKECVLCKNGVSKGGLVTRCDSCPKGSIRDGGICTCPDGESKHDGKCVKRCPPGHVLVIGGECEKCREGTYGNGGVQGCLPCPYGTWSEPGASECEPWTCPTGYFRGYRPWISTTEKECLSGQTGCPEGTTVENIGGFGFCVKPNGDPICPDGSIFDGENFCTSCNPTQFLKPNRDGVLLCEDCPSGSLAPGPTDTECVACEDGYETYIPFFLVDDVARCSCPSGKYINEDGECLKCPPGTISADRDMRECKTCPEGFIEIDSTECVCELPKLVNKRGKCVRDRSGVDYN